MVPLSYKLRCSAMVSSWTVYHQELRGYLQTFEWQRLGHIEPKITLLQLQEVSVLDSSYPALLGSVSEWQGWITVQVMVFSRFDINCHPNTDDIPTYKSISDFLELQFDISNSWTFPPGCLAHHSNPIYLKLNPAAFSQTNFLSSLI